MKKPISKKGKKGLGLLIIIVLSLVIIVFLLNRLDSILMPTALDIAERVIISDISRVIDNAYSSIIKEQYIEAADLFIIQADEQSGRVSSMYVDTLLVNEICNKLAVRISSDMNSLSIKTVDVPMGSLTGYNIFAGTGPAYQISVRPTGDALVNPRSERESVGINQVNIMLWLDVKCEARIVTPFQNGREIIIERSLPLINTYFSQDVPNMYWNNRGGITVGPEAEK